MSWLPPNGPPGPPDPPPPIPTPLPSRRPRFVQLPQNTILPRTDPPLPPPDTLPLWAALDQPRLARFQPGPPPPRTDYPPFPPRLSLEQHRLIFTVDSELLQVDLGSSDGLSNLDLAMFSEFQTAPSTESRLFQAVEAYAPHLDDDDKSRDFLVVRGPQLTDLNFLNQLWQILANPSPWTVTA